MFRVNQQDSTLSAFGDYIRAQRRLARISQRRLGKLTGVSDSYLSQVERGLYRPSAQVVKALADAFGIPPQSLYAQLGLLDAESTTPTSVERAIQDDARLGPEQKKALTMMYRTLADDAGRASGT